ncbi:MAG: peptide-binding protein [Zetaproteobacteria bacterium CG06_land_8_20_14_3_00_59_53]|nr:MAG: peptide-binding protein [Zetaproteobacteria bacterium CG2_30_59_37]PIO89991.1 MAG: peptide-binding protein [Zetaproteobacteria bacterium CG23_combo_of_CG06-09_8_20_14_all_59_86]PIQ64097.1 MAG: peptide-binding protein [Zetaproteobacteria bacterium CG11_big_fil_rev_8_21_14_0_20_59_439]PIU69922.1 MAG: peptide-binding protein [Zetaproteobacteria bacterium CG06_land_8_20_14_3_00_59_53]PIU97597.1 MAG: peptide-binding protein [Zetaproteobacteria bacterium CG03_land_8_20_14_0_80_59_51]PIY47097
MKPLLQRNVFFLIAIALLGAACSQDDGKTTLSSGLETHTQASIEPARGDRLVSASIGDASNLIPMIASDASSHAIAGQMYLSLLKYDKDLNLTGQLAESWQVAKDNLSIRFKLRQGLKWTDGKPLTSADCAFTLKLLLDEHTQSAYKSDYVKVIRVETADALSFTVYYDEPYSPALSSWTGLAILPEHVFKGVDIMNTELSRKPAATIGPYILGEWQAQQSILLSANKDYFDGPVWISERMTRIIPDSATQFLELSAGNLDSMGLTPTQYSRLFEQKEQLKRNYERYKYLDFGYTYLGFNLKRAPFDDARVRRAIAYAIDRQEIVDGVLLGLGEAIATPYKPGTYWVNKNIKVRPFDAGKARALLAEAGWTDSNADGVMDKDGKPLSFTILTNNGNKQRADTATIIQQRLKDVGIQVKVRLVEWSAFIENFINKRDFDAVILGWSLSPEPDQFSIWHSSQTGARQFNFLGYNNPKVDAALVAATRIFDRAERKAFYDEVQRQIHEDVPVVFLYAPYSLPVFHKRIHGIEAAPAGIGWNSEHWYVPAAEQKYTVNAITP